ncbi:MAG: tetratricopeptide repeat protein [candidate division NC10 bacterium]|nr:tetratricopeptide repeat protein [candidate division NC10 bacterium]MCH7896129.1 tetratricopeptide repeat protein [candidate division NC10 bacterium]MCZ6550431.1 tetratricopeptide repeat protein [candidate division NC10 bacterium]
MRHLLVPWIIGILLGGASLAHASLELEEKAMQAYQQGDALRRAGRYEEAVRAYWQTLQIFPEHPAAFDRLRAIYNSGHTAAETIKLLEGRVARVEGNFIAWNLLGVLYGRERRWNEALKAFERSLAAEPRAADTLVNRGWILVELRRYEDAVAAFEAALKHQPRLARAHAGLGSALVEARGEYSEGMNRYLTAVQLDPENPALLNDLGWIAFKMRRYPEAVAALEKASTLDPQNPMIQTNLGLAYQKVDKTEEALAQFHRALAVNPEYTLALYGVGKVYETRGQYPGALQAYRQAWKQSGNDLYLFLWVQAYMSSHGQAMIFFLFAFLAVGGVAALRSLRGRRAPATTKG